MPLRPAALRAVAWTLGAMRNISLPLAGFSGLLPSSTHAAMWSSTTAWKFASNSETDYP